MDELTREQVESLARACRAAEERGMAVQIDPGGVQLILRVITSLRQQVQGWKDEARRVEQERDHIQALYQAGCDAWNPTYKIVLDERDVLRQQLQASQERAKKVEDDCEYERIRLAACSDVAFAKHPLPADNQYRSATYNDLWSMRNRLEQQLAEAQTTITAQAERAEKAEGERNQHEDQDMRNRKAFNHTIKELVSKLEASVSMETHNHIVTSMILSLDDERTEFERQIADLTATLNAMYQDHPESGGCYAALPKLRAQLEAMTQERDVLRRELNEAQASSDTWEKNVTHWGMEVKRLEAQLAEAQASSDTLLECIEGPGGWRETLRATREERAALLGLFCDHDFTPTIQQAHVMWNTQREQLIASEQRAEKAERERAIWFDRYHSTPCEQIRHMQQVEDLTAKMEAVQEENLFIKKQYSVQEAQLAAAQAEVARLREGQYKAKLYDLIIDLSRMELGEMSVSGRAAWDRLVKGGWYTDDLEALLSRALVSEKEPTDSSRAQPTMTAMQQMPDGMNELYDCVKKQP